MKIDKSFMQNMDSRKRVNLIHSLSGFSPSVLVGSMNKEGQENLAIFNSLIHLGSNPALFGLKFRPHTVPRHTLENILETEYFTINHISKSMVDQAHQTSGKYPAEISEFDTCGLKSTYLNNFRAPFVVKSPIKMAMRYVEHHHISANATIFLVAELEAAYINQEQDLQNGSLPLSELDIVALNGLYQYYDTSLLVKKEYVSV